jgi:hypothetical protein
MLKDLFKPRYRVKMIEYRSGAKAYWPQVKVSFFWHDLDKWGFITEDAAWELIASIIHAQGVKSIIRRENLYRNI